MGIICIFFFSLWSGFCLIHSKRLRSSRSEGSLTHSVNWLIFSLTLKLCLVHIWNFDKLFPFIFNRVSVRVKPCQTCSGHQDSNTKTANATARRHTSGPVMIMYTNISSGKEFSLDKAFHESRNRAKQHGDLKRHVSLSLAGVLRNPAVQCGRGG